jgi:hypothetical protein
MLLMPLRAPGGEERYERPCWLEGAASVAANGAGEVR